MPITVKNKLTGQTKEIKGSQFGKGEFTDNLWEVIRQNDIIRLYLTEHGTSRLLGKYDKSEPFVGSLLTNYPTSYFELEPDILNHTDYKNTPIEYPANEVNVNHRVARYTNTDAIKKTYKLSGKNILEMIIGGIIVGLITAFIIYWLKLNAVRQ